jgi:endoplasmic reticulum resident protein 44
MLAPIWDEAADKIEAEFPDPGRVKIGKVDCDSESENKKDLIYETR